MLAGVAAGARAASPAHRTRADVTARGCGLLSADAAGTTAYGQPALQYYGADAPSSQRSLRRSPANFYLVSASWLLLVQCRGGPVGLFKLESYAHDERLLALDMEVTVSDAASRA